MSATDILRPETVALKMVESWVKAGLPWADLQTIVDPLQRELADLMQKVYQSCNDFCRPRDPGAAGLAGAGSTALQRPVPSSASRSGLAGTGAIPGSDGFAARHAASGRGMPSRMAHPGSMHGMAHAAALSGMTPLARSASAGLWRGGAIAPPSDDFCHRF